LSRVGLVPRSLPHLGQEPSRCSRVCVSDQRRLASKDPTTKAPIAHGACGGTTATRGAARSPSAKDRAAPATLHPRGRASTRTRARAGSNPNRTRRPDCTRWSTVPPGEGSEARSRSSRRPSAPDRSSLGPVTAGSLSDPGAGVPHPRFAKFRSRSPASRSVSSRLQNTNRTSDRPAPSLA